MRADATGALMTLKVPCASAINVMPNATMARKAKVTNCFIAAF